MATVKLSNAQMSAFDGELLKDFRVFMLEQLRNDGGDAFAGRSDDQLFAFIDAGIKRAQSYGATTQTAYGMFMSAQVLLGDDFNSSGAYPWAEAALKDTAITDPNARLDNLMVLIALYFDETADSETETERTTS